MPKSKNRKAHSQKVLVYKANNKKTQELLKKKMMDDYIKLQQELMSQNVHTSTEDVIDSDIDIDGLNFDNIDETIDINLNEFNTDNTTEELNIDVETTENKELVVE